MLTENQVLEDLQKLVSTITDDDIVLSLNTEIAELCLNSLNMLYTIVILEEKYNLRFDTKKLIDYKTIGDIINYIIAYGKI